MRDYRGFKNNKILKGGGYVRDEGYGHEMFNFQPFKGRIYGYVRPTGDAGHINLERIGGNPGTAKLVDVLVIWTASSPHGGTRVVGWFNHATVYRGYQGSPHDPKRRYKRKAIGYYASAKQRDGMLLPPSSRVIHVPRGKGGIGQSNIWYGDNSNGRSLIKRVEEFIRTGTAYWPERKFNRAQTKAKLKGGPHTLRHTFSSHFLATQPDLFLLARVLGHSDVAVTKIYSHLLPDHLARARNAVSIGPSIGPAALTARRRWGSSEVLTEPAPAEPSL